MPYGVVSVGPGIGVSDRVHVPLGNGRFWVFLPIGLNGVLSVF